MNSATSPQRTQLINALRGHLTEFGEVVPQGTSNVSKLITIVEDPTSGLPSEAVVTLQILILSLRHLEAEITKLDDEIARRAKEDDLAKRLMTIPGIGPLIATAFATLAPAAETFRKGRDFAAWLGLVPRQHSTGGKQRLGATTKMGERSLRRLARSSAPIASSSSGTCMLAQSLEAGWARCSLGSPPCWCGWHWPTKWRGSYGP